jgi:hypothetical protein
MILLKSLPYYPCLWHKKKHINATLNTQVFTREGELQ